MKSKTFQTVIPNRMDERLVMVAINTDGMFTEEQRMQLRHLAWKRIGGRNISTHSVVIIGFVTVFRVERVFGFHNRKSLV